MLSLVEIPTKEMRSQLAVGTQQVPISVGLFLLLLLLNLNPFPSPQQSCPVSGQMAQAKF